MDLSRAFDCMLHGLRAAKLHYFGVSPKASECVTDYLKDRMQTVKHVNTYSNWTKINRCVPQSSVLGSLLFNIFPNDLFYLPIECSLVNDADDNHMCNDNGNLEMLKDHIESDAMRAINWFDKKSNHCQHRQITKHFVVSRLHGRFSCQCRWSFFSSKQYI